MTLEAAHEQPADSPEAMSAEAEVLQNMFDHSLSPQETQVLEAAANRAATALHMEFPDALKVVSLALRDAQQAGREVTQQDIKHHAQALHAVSRAAA